MQRFGCQIHHHRFIGHLQHPIRHGFAYGHACDCADGWRNAFDVLDVHGGNYVDLRFEELEHVFISFAMFAARDIGVCKFVYQDHRWATRQNSVRVHFFEQRALVIDFPARHGFQLFGKLDDSFASVIFDDAYHHVFAASLPANGFAQHGVGFPDARRVAEKKLQRTLGFVGRF